MTPYEAWFDQRPDLRHLRIFGCRCYGHVEKKNRTKWESHTAEGILMGYFAHEGLYAVYDVNKRVMIKKRDVTFFENVIGHPSMDGFGLPPGYNILGEPIVRVEQIPQILEDEDNWDDIGELRVGDLKPSTDEVLAMTIASLHRTVEEESDYVPVDTMVATVSMSFVHHALKEWQQERKKQRTDEVGDSELTVDELVKRYELRYEDLRMEYGITEKVDVMRAVDEEDPKTWRQAMASPNKALWLKAALDEIIAITRIATFDFVLDIPHGRRPLPTK